MISLPSHFKVDDPENSGFGRRLRNKNFNNDQIIQASTLEEVRASRVRKRIFSTSVISERTIQLKDEDDTNNFRNRGPEKSTKGPPFQTTIPGGLGSSRAIIKYVSTVPPAPFGTRTIPTETSEKKKVTIRTVIRRPPTRPNSDSSSVINTTVQPNRNRSRVRIKDSLLARVQGRLRARSTTPEPFKTTTETVTRITTIKEPVPEFVETTVVEKEPLTTTRFENVESTERYVQETTEVEQEEVKETTLDPEVGTTEPPVEIFEEEEVITETSVAMSIGESEAHKVVMTTVKSEETTLDNWDTTEPIRTTEVEDEELFYAEDVTSKTPPAEGLLGSSLERPDGLQKELLAAIRRKISKTRENQNKVVQPPKNISSEDIQVSPASNSVGSTQHPPFFRPIPFPASNQDNRNNNPRVRIFLRVPDEKPGSNPIKIHNFSHLQGKLVTEVVHEELFDAENITSKKVFWVVHWKDQMVYKSTFSSFHKKVFKTRENSTSKNR